MFVLARQYFSLAHTVLVSEVLSIFSSAAQWQTCSLRTSFHWTVPLALYDVCIILSASIAITQTQRSLSPVCRSCFFTSSSLYKSKSQHQPVICCFGSGVLSLCWQDTAVLGLPNIKTLLFSDGVGPAFWKCTVALFCLVLTETVRHMENL